LGDFNWNWIKNITGLLPADFADAAENIQAIGSIRSKIKPAVIFNIPLT
jgi:hypothetical protein